MECEENDPKMFWKLLNDLRNNKKNNSNPITLDKWSSYFNNLHNTVMADNGDTVFQMKITKKLEKLIKVKKEENSCIFDNRFTLNEIENGIKQLKTNKASGLDAISNEMLKVGKQILKPYLCNLFNNIIKNEYYPNVWSDGYI